MENRPGTFTRFESAIFRHLHWGLYAWAALLVVQLSLPRLLGVRFAPSDVLLVLTGAGLLWRALRGEGLRAALQAWRTSLDGWLLALILVFAMGTLVVWLRTGTVSSYALLNKDVGLFVLIASYYLASILLTNKVRIERLVQVLVASASIVTIVSLAAFVAWSAFGIQSRFILGTTGRLVGLLLDPGAYGGLLAVTILLQLGLLVFGSSRKGALRALLGANAVLLTAALVLTRSRSAWLGFLVGLAVLLWLSRRWFSRKRILIGGLVLAGAIALAYGFLGPHIGRFISSTLNDRTVLIRWDVISLGFQQFVHSPVWGIGLDGTRALGTQDIIHNSYLFFLIEMGLVGLAVLAGLLTRVGCNLRRAVLAPNVQRSLSVGVVAGWAALLGLALGIEAFYQRELWLLFAVAEGLRRVALPRVLASPGGWPRVLVMTTIAGTLRTVLIPHLTALQRAGYEVEVACRKGSPASTEALADQPFPVHYLPLQRRPLSWGNVVGLARLVRLIRERGYGIVHVHTPTAGFLGRLAARLAGTGATTVYTAHGFHFCKGKSPLRNAAVLALEKLASRWTDHLVVINHEDERAAHRYRLAPPGRIHLSHGVGIDRAVYSPAAVSAEDVAAVRGELGLSPEDRLFLIVGELNPRKRHRDAIEALKRLNRPHAHLAFAGGGALRERLQAFARRLELADRVHFLGSRSDVAALLRAAVALLLPSQQEGLPRSLMEALCLEVPAIATDVRGNRDVLADGGGILVPLGDVDALAKAMAWVLDHPDEATALGRQGRQAMATYDLDAVLAEHLALYEEIVRERRGGQRVC